MVSASPGSIASRGDTSMYLRPSLLSIAPQLGTSSGKPKPRKLSDASEMITPPTVIEKITMMGAAMLGHTWRSRVRVCRLPMLRAASK